MLQPRDEDFAQGRHPTEEDRTELRKLLADIEEFCARKGMSETRFGRLAVDDAHFVRRLRNGSDIRSTRAAMARRLMRNYGRRPKR